MTTLATGFFPRWFVLLILVGLHGCSRPEAASPSIVAGTLVENLRAQDPTVTVAQVFQSEILGLYGVELAGGNFVYGTADGRHIIAGDLYALGGSLSNLTEIRREVWRQGLLAKVEPGVAIPYPASESRWAITVFTDVDCVHCRRLHSEMHQLNEAGVSVRYLAYPRAGLESTSYKDMVSAWCSVDRQAALTRLKLGESIPEQACDNPVAAQYAFAKRLGLTGTPGVVTESGKLIIGFESVQLLLAAIQIREGKTD